MLDEHLYWVMAMATGSIRSASRKRRLPAGSAGRAQLPSSAGCLSDAAADPWCAAWPCLGRHSRDTIYQFGIADVAALGHWLGSRRYGFGDTPTVVDACMAAYIGNIIRQWSNRLCAATAKYGDLVAHF